MQKAPSPTQLRKAFADICKGYTVSSHKKQDLYIKHFSHFDQVDIDLVYDKALAKARKRGIQTLEEILALLDKKGKWTQKNEIEINKQKDFISNLVKTKEKLLLPSQALEHQKLIDKEQDKLNDLVNTKNRLIGLNAEYVANLAIQYEYLRLGLFRDRNFTQPLLTPEDVSALYDEESFELLDLYVESIKIFDTDILKRIAIAPFFTNSFYLCGQDISIYFKKPMVDLTIYQTNLLSYGLYYKNIMSGLEDIPNDIKDDPDAIEAMARGRQSRDAVLAKAGNGQRVGLFGAKDSDFKSLGIKNDSDKMSEMANKNFKSGRDAVNNGVSYTVK